MTNNRIEYPLWATETYTGLKLELKKWKTKRKLGGILISIGFAAIFCVVITIIWILTSKTGADDVKFMTFMLLVLSVVLFLALGGNLSKAGSKEEQTFEQDWSKLQKQLHCDFTNSTLEEFVLDKVHCVLIRDATWAIMAELAKDQIKEFEQKEMMRLHYLFFMRFGFLKIMPTSSSLSQLPVGPFFDAAKSKLAETLDLMVKRLGK